MPWSGFYDGGEWTSQSRAPIIIKNAPVPYAGGRGAETAMIGGAVVLGVVALAAIVYGATKKA